LCDCGNDADVLRLWLNQIQPDANGQPFDVRTLQISPNTWLPSAIAQKHELPDGMSVNIFREGKNPAKITVKQGNLKWEVNEDELSKLPDDIRKDVEPFVTGGAGTINLSIGSDQGVRTLRLAAPDFVNLEGESGDVADRLQKSIDAIDRQLEQIRYWQGQIPIARRGAHSPRAKFELRRTRPTGSTRW